MERDPADLIEAYFSGELDELGTSSLRAWLREDPERLEKLAAASRLEGTLHQIYKARRLQGAFDTADLFDELQRDAESRTDLVSLQAISVSQSEDAPAERSEGFREVIRILSNRDFIAYIAGRAIRTRPAKWIATAAVIAISVLLLIVFIVPDKSTTPSPGPIVTIPSVPTPGAMIVATLTAEHDAVWDRRPGDDLYAGQRFTLTQGFAEITTNRGAIVTLESPCTVELLDNNNAIRLHVGKLMGHCPTRHSQGFIVRTPTTQVIDLGTEFGVEVDSAGETDVYVFTGLVALADPQEDPRTAELTEIAAGQGKRVDRQGKTSPLIEADAGERFVRSIDAGALYERMILADKPVVYYRMDNVIGGVERNLASDRYHAKVFGDVTAVTESGRSSFSLAARGAHLQTAEPIAELRGATFFTIECWVRPTRYDFGSICNMELFNTESGGPLYFAARLELMPTAGLPGPNKRFRFVQGHRMVLNEDVQAKQPAQPRTVVFSNNAYALDQWVHLAAVKDGEHMTLYVNGEARGTAAEASPLVEEDTVLTLGRLMTADTTRDDHARQFIGQIDEFAVYAHALPLESIRTRYTSGKHSEDRP